MKEMHLNFKFFRCFSAALLMLLPMGVGAQNYKLFIGDYEGYDNPTPVGVSVNSTNASNITHDCIKTGTVSFDYASRTLTLENATINGSIYSGGALIINLIGDNYITAADSSAIVGEVSEAAQALTIKGTGTLLAKGTTAYVTDGFNDPTFQDGQSLLLWDGYDEDRIFKALYGTQLFSGGNGNSADTPYLISSVADLKNLSFYVSEGLLSNKFYELKNDIDCSNMTDFVPIGNSVSYPFTGTFNGNNKKITGLSYTTDNPYNYVGLFARVGQESGDDGNIENLELKDCSFGGGVYAGAIAGSFLNGSMQYCKVSGETTISAVGDDAKAGALIGNYSAGALTANYYYYSVTTSKTTDNGQIITSGYDQRGLGTVVDQSTGYYDVFTDDGAVMYTKLVNIPGETGQGSVEGAEDRYDREGADYESEMYIAPGETAMFSVRCEDGYIPHTVQVTYGTPATTINPTLESFSDGIYYYNFEMPDKEATISVTYANGTGYNLFIGNTQVSSANKDDVLGDGKVSFSVGGDVAVIYTLTLNGAELTDPIKIGLSNLTFDIQGANSITTTETCIQKMDNTNPSVTFTSTSAEVGSLSLKGADGVYGVGYGTFSISDKLALVLKKDGYLYSNQYHFTDGSTKEAKLSPSYGVTVGKMQICPDNAADVIGDGIGDGDDKEMVSFDKATSTLTLKGANLSGIIRSSLPNLIIELEGDNSIYSSGDRAIQAGTPVNITIKSSTRNGTLNMHKGYSSSEKGNFVDDNVTLTIANPLSVLSGSLTSDEAENDYYATIGVSYGITITKEGVDYSINSTNRTNVLNDEAGTVQFDGSNTLILNNADIAGITIEAESSLSELKIYLTGNNKITNDTKKAVVNNSQLMLSLYFTTSTATDNAGTLTYTFPLDGTITDPEQLFENCNVQFKDNLSGVVMPGASTMELTIAVRMTPIVTPERKAAVNNGTNIDPDAPGEGLGRDIEDISATEAVSVVKHNILYVLNNEDGYFKEPNSDKVVLLNTYMDDLAVRTHVARPVNKKQLFPNTPSFSIYFKGMCFLVSAGSGQIVVEANTPQSGELHMMFGDEKYTVTKIPLGPTMTMYNVPYTFTKDTYVYLYSGVEASNVNASSRLDGSRRAPGRKMTTTTSIRRAGVRAASACSAPSPSLAPTTLTKDDVDDLIASAGDLSNGLTITGADYTDIDADAFESLTGEKISYVDLSGTGIIDQTIDRTKAPYKDIPAGSFIYMPVSNDIPVDADDNPILDNAKNVVIGSSCLNMLLPDDGTPFKAATDFSAGHTKMARTFTEGVNGTIYLPFAIDDKDELESHGTFYQMKSVEGTTITMESVESTKANVPYMFKPAKSEFEVDAVVNVETAIPDPDDAKVGDIAFIGTYQQQSLLSGSNDIYCFIGEGADAGKFVRVETAKVTINPFRGYLVGPASASPARFFNLNTGEATSISEKGIVNSEKFATATYFDLQGRRVLNPKKGIYILNGRKVIIK